MAFIQKLFIEKYRGIKGLKINDLKQINLVVGDNNCGKTSVLEAIELFRTSASAINVFRIARQRESISVLNANSAFDNFMCIFPRNDGEKKQVSVLGTCNSKDISVSINGKQYKEWVNATDYVDKMYKIKDFMNIESEAAAFDGELNLSYDDLKKKTPIKLNQYTIMKDSLTSEKDKFDIVYVAPFEHLKGNILDVILRNDVYKQICIRALQLFDPDIEDMMIFRSDVGNRPVEYLRHKKLGDMPISSYGDGIKKVLALSNAVARASGGILLIDEIETAIHKKYYDDIFKFILKACKSFDVQAFITTHSLEAIDGILAAQEYDKQNDEDNICVCTLKKADGKTYSRVMPGRDVYLNRDAFGFEVRL